MNYAQGRGPHFQTPDTARSDEPTADKYARLSMYLGLGSLLFTCFSGIPAIVLGAMALKKGARAKRTEAVVGLTIGSLATVGVVVVITAVAVMPDSAKNPTVQVAASAAPPATPQAAAQPTESASAAALPVSPKSPLEELAAQATPVSQFKIGASESWALLPPGTTDCGVDADGKVVHLDKPSSSDEFEAHRQEQQRDALKAKFVAKLVSFGDKDVDVQFPVAYDFKSQTLRVTVSIDGTAVGSRWPFSGQAPTFRQETDSFDTKEKVGELGGKDLTVAGQETLIRYETIPSTFDVHVAPEQAERWKSGNGQIHSLVVERFLGLGFHKVCRNSCAHLLGTTQCSNDNVGVGEYNRAEVLGYRIMIDETVIAEKQPLLTPQADAGTSP